LAIATWLAEWPRREKEWSDLLTLGDFNIDRQGDPLWQALTPTGPTTPAALLSTLGAIRRRRGPPGVF
jgi:hypothetical protein